MTEEEIQKAYSDDMEIVELKTYQWRAIMESEKKYAMLHRQLLEYMGYEDEFLITAVGLKKLKKNHLIQMVLEQRGMIRKLIDDLEPVKREKHISFLDNLYLNRT